MKIFGIESVNYQGFKAVKSLDEVCEDERYLECQNNSILDYDLSVLLRNDLLGELVTYDPYSNILYDKEFRLKTEKNAFYGVQKLGAKVRTKHQSTVNFCIPVIKSKVSAPPALFLDRDGVIVHGALYSIDPEKVFINQEIIPHLQKATREGIKIFIVTNQSGVGRGHFSEDELKSFHKKLERDLLGHGIKVTHWYYSPCHTEANPPYNKRSLLRKPLPGMIMWASSDYEINFSKSLMVGDRLSDQLWCPGLKIALIKHMESIDHAKAPTFKSMNDLFSYFWRIQS